MSAKRNGSDPSTTDRLKTALGAAEGKPQSEMPQHLLKVNFL